MATVFEIGLANAVVAAFLGAGTFLVGRWLRRPAVIHVLWIVVLVKLITPPLFLVPLPSLCLAESPREVENGSTGPLSESRSQTGVPKPESVGLPAAAFEPNVPGISVLEDFGAEPDDNPFQPPEDTSPNSKSAKIENEPVAATVPPKVIGRNGGTASLTEIPQPMAGSSKTNPPQTWGPKLRSMALQGLSLVWIVGSLAFIGLMGLRIRRFRRLLGQAGVSAPEELCRELVGLARSMGLSRVPKLVLVPGTVSPLVWAVDLRPVIVFPQGLLERLDALGRRSLLLHELTHLRRRDHWVRGLELIVSCLYWWLPLVWLARRELQQAEEECCDAWVVWWMEGERRPYALALLQTLDFLAGIPAEMPPAASGLGHVAFLRQRLKGILREDIPRSMGWREMLAIVLCSLMVLPVIPSWGQSGEEPPAGAVITPNAEAISNTPSEKESNPAPLSTAAIVAKQVDYRAVPMLDSIDFQPQSQTFPPVVQYAQGSAFSGDGRWLITVYGRPHETGEVRIWNVATHEEQAMWKEPIGMRSVAMAPDGKTFAYGTYGGVIQLGDIETGKRLTAWDAIPTGIESLSFSADGRWLVAGTSEGVVHVWEVATAKITQTLKGHKGRVYAVGFLPDNATILSSGFDKTLKFWERSNGHMIRSVEQPDQVFSLAVAPDGKRVATACQDGRVRLFDPTGEPQTTLTPPQGAVSVAFAPSGKTLAVSHGGTVSLWNVNIGQSLAVIQANQEVVHQVAISRDGKTLATTSWDRSVKFWNLETQAELATLLPAPKTHDEPQSIQAVA